MTPKEKKKRIDRVWDVAFATYVATHPDTPFYDLSVYARNVADAAAELAEKALRDR